MKEWIPDWTAVLHAHNWNTNQRYGNKCHAWTANVSTSGYYMIRANPPSDTIWFNLAHVDEI